MVNISRQQLALAWCGAILALSAVAVFAGASMTVGDGVLALVAGAVPAVVMMIIWRPAPTVAKLRHDANAAARAHRQ